MSQGEKQNNTRTGGVWSTPVRQQTKSNIGTRGFTTERTSVNLNNNNAGKIEKEEVKQQNNNNITSKLSPPVNSIVEESSKETSENNDIIISECSAGKLSILLPTPKKLAQNSKESQNSPGKEQTKEQEEVEAPPVQKSPINIDASAISITSTTEIQTKQKEENEENEEKEETKTKEELDEIKEKVKLRVARRVKPPALNSTVHTSTSNSGSFLIVKNTASKQKFLIEAEERATFTNGSTLKYDGCNNQFLSIYENKVERISMDKEDVNTFILQLPFEVVDCITAKFSLDMNYLFVLYPKKLAIISVVNSLLYYHHLTKDITDFYFPTNTTIVLIYATGFYYMKYSKKKCLKLIKKKTIDNIAWARYHHKLLVVLRNLNEVNCFLFAEESVIEIQRFEVANIDCNSQPFRVHYKEILVSRLYEKLAIVHIQPFQKEIHIYYMSHKMPPTRQLVIPLCIEGRLTISIIDSLIIVHNLTEHLSFIIDIAEEGTFVAPPLSMAPLPPPYEELTLYSMGVDYMLPNIVVDRKAGLIWSLDINLDALSCNFTDDFLKLEFLRRRSNSQKLVCNSIILMIRNCLPLSSLSSIFDCLNSFLSSSSSREEIGTKKKKETDFLDLYYLEDNKQPAEPLRISQSLCYQKVFLYIFHQMTNKQNKIKKEKKKNSFRFGDDHNFECVQPKYFLDVVVMYLKSITSFNIDVFPDIEVLVIEICVYYKFYRYLHNLIDFRIVSDSPQLACKLLSMENKYPPAKQMALEMFCRLGQPIPTIIEVLLSQHKVKLAIGLLMAAGDKVDTYQFLCTAKDIGDPVIYYHVYQFFKKEEPNTILNFPPTLEDEESYDEENET